jgi:hypothetical protein
MKYAITSENHAQEPHIMAFPTDFARAQHIERHGGRAISHLEARRRLEAQVRLAIRFGCIFYLIEPYEVRVLSMDELYMTYRRAYCY